jgi:hypothetical protein
LAGILVTEMSDVPDLTEEQMLERLQEWAAADRDGHLIECADEAALRALFAGLSNQAV